jgi:hypothetical protein
VPEFEVENMPVTVAVDSNGESVHETGPKEWRVNCFTDSRREITARQSNSCDYPVLEIRTRHILEPRKIVGEKHQLQQARAQTN